MFRARLRWKESGWCRSGHIGAVSAVLAIAVVMGGCAAAVPQVELAAYQAAFAETRDIGLAVIDDFAIEWDDVDADRGPADHPAARRHLWRVLDDYNNALVALAGPTSPKDAHYRVNRLAASLAALPATGAGAAGDAMAPLGGIAAEALRAIDDRVRTRRFREAVLAGAPVVKAILELKQNEARDLMAWREAIYRERMLAIEADVQIQLLPIFEAIYQEAAADETGRKRELLDRLNRAMETGFDYGPDERLPGDLSHGQAPFTAAGRAELARIARDVEQLAEQHAAHQRAITHYRTLMDGYRDLLAATRSAMADLQRSVRTGEPAAVDGEAMMLDALAVYREYLLYREAR